MLEGNVASLVPAGRCRSEARLENLITKRHNFASPRVPFDGDPASLTVPLDWSIVNSVRVGKESLWKDGDRVDTGAYYVAVNGSVPSIYFVHSTEEDAKRAAFAMEFLKTECGLKSEQGF